MGELVNGDMPGFSEAVEAAANELGAKFHPAWETWTKFNGPRPPGVTAMEHGEWTPMPAGSADSSTMITFTASDGYTSMRALTWREVVAAAYPVIRDAVLADERDENRRQFQEFMRLVAAIATERGGELRVKAFTLVTIDNDAVLERFDDQLTDELVFRVRASAGDTSTNTGEPE